MCDHTASQYPGFSCVNMGIYDMHCCTELIHTSDYTAFLQLMHYACRIPEKEAVFSCHSQSGHTHLSLSIRALLWSELDNWHVMKISSESLPVTICFQAGIWLTSFRQVWNRILKMEFWILPVCRISLMVMLMSSTVQVNDKRCFLWCKVSPALFNLEIIVAASLFVNALFELYFQSWQYLTASRCRCV